MSTLVDTTVVVDFLRNRPPVTEKLRSLFPRGISLSAVSVAELLHGAHISARPKENEAQIRRFITESGVSLLDVDVCVAERYAEEQARLEHAGRRMPGFDLLIAATALVYQLTLVTSDRAFTRVHELNVVLL